MIILTLFRKFQLILTGFLAIFNGFSAVSGCQNSKKFTTAIATTSRKPFATAIRWPVGPLFASPLANTNTLITATAVIFNVSKAKKKTICEIKIWNHKINQGQLCVVWP